MTIIDVDLHFEVALGPDDHPLREYAERFPSPEGFVADAIAGDLARHTPEQSRPSETELAMFLPPENRASVDQCTRPGTMDASAYPFLGATVDERVAWLDSIGIDHAIVNPGGYGFLVGWLREDERVRGARLCNDYMADRLEGHTDRMMPVTLVDWSDLDDVVAELTRMRARGSRAFWLRAEPVDGKSPAHPDWDRVWSAATDLGMLAILHVGNTPARFEGGWGNAAWERPGGTGLGGFFRYANSLRHQAAEMMLGAMLYGGVFGRHPNLTMLTEELNVAWLPYFVTRCEGLDPAGPWPFDLLPSEMVRRNVRATPLPGLGDRDVLSEGLRLLPEMLVFSSDYPHGEGNADPIALYEPELSALSPEVRRGFLGDNIAECFARTGDPLTRW